MKPETVNYLLSPLDSQYSHIADCKRRSKAAAERQRLYYTGVFTAVNAAISEAFSEPVAVFLDHRGRHSVIECPALRADPEEVPAF